MSKKMNKVINFSHYGTLLSFSVEKEGNIVLLYAGKEKKLSNVSKQQRKYRSVVEAEILEANTNTRHGNKHIETSFGLTSKYVSHYEKENSLGVELVITTKNEFMSVDTHIQFYKGVIGISSYNVTTNISNKPITLLYISSFVNIGFSKANNKHLYLHQADNSWHTEAQWKKDSFFHLGIYNGNDFFANKRYSLSNCGSWSTKEHLPMMIIEDKFHRDFSLVQIESNGSWNLEIGDYMNHLYYLATGPEFSDHDFITVLNTNDKFKSVQATLTFGNDFESVIKEITKIRRKYRKPNKDNETLPVIFNDYMHALWDTQTTELILPLVDIASEVNCDIFVMDAGWFALGSQWWDIIGDWEVYEPNFPNGGFKKVCDYIRSKNMKAGLWFEPEAVGINSKAGKTLPNNYFFCYGDKPITINKRHMLNFDNPEVYKRMFKIVSSMIEKYDLKYVKFDYNYDIGKGTNLNYSSFGQGLLAHNRAFIAWLNELTDKYPDVIIENCASGGCRMDNEILKYCSIQSTSDQTSYKKYPYLSGNVLTATTPEQAAVWSYPVNAYIKGYMPSDEAVVANMCNAMLGRIHLASYINKLPESQLELIKEGVKFFNSISNIKKNSFPIYPKGTASFGDKEVVAGLESDKSIILGVWNTSNKARTIKVDLSKYNFKDIKVGYPLSLDTDYSFDKISKVLTINMSSPNSGRMFIINK